MRNNKHETRTKAKDWLVRNGYSLSRGVWHSDNGKRVARIERSVVSGFKVVEEWNW